VYQLRRVLAPHCPVHTVREVYRYESDPAVQCDVADFVSLLSRARQVRGEAALECLEVAVRRYRGPLLEGLEGQWVEGPRATLERQFLEAAQTLLTAYEQSGRHDAAIDLAQHVLAMDPFEEEFHLALMRHQLESGHLAAARRHYRHYSRVMREELGQEPAPDAAVMFAQSGVRLLEQG
jgi:DNA-binding SARP family transcriptional activator